ncbi:KilA-N domain [Mannheimia haemolytica]|uniref:KilA-N domain-containing protein n=1 Tax=Mannheimia haemolytica TaxID=75985 RepID=UPI000E00AF02|nr:KilA-N domain-containing protein [Mannheimia haemolytica]STY50071.1 KilA-N domain [Mannheimia haemolytica]
MSNLTILNKAIRQSENLFSLNDLHRAGGGESKHQPAFFVRLDTTQDLISEIQKEDPNFQPLKSINGGANRGTYACMEIALAYASWIDPKFHLVVLRAYMAMKAGEHSQNNQQIAPLALPEKPRKIQGTTRAAEGEYLYTREFSAMEIDHLAKLWDIAEEQHKFIESLTPLFETMQSEQWFKKHSRALNCFNHHNYSYHILSEMCEDVEEWTGIMPSIRAVKMKGKYYSRF